MHQRALRTLGPEEWAEYQEIVRQKEGLGPEEWAETQEIERQKGGQRTMFDLFSEEPADGQRDMMDILKEDAEENL